jgi:hypothetical protein
LAAESALYCRIYTEGLFGIRPSGLHSFDLTPRLPANWNEMKLKSVEAFGHSFDIDIARMGAKIRVTIAGLGAAPILYEISDGETAAVRLE